MIERSARILALEPARKRMRAAAPAARRSRWPRRRIREVATRTAPTTLIATAVAGGLGGGIATAVGSLVNHDHNVVVAREFSTGRPEQATDSQAYVARHSDDNGSWWAIDRVRVTLPGDPAWIETENIQGYGGVGVDDPPYKGWQDPEPLHHYAAPTPVHVLPGPDGPRVMSDEDIHSWLTTPWPRFWHQARFYGWFGIAWAALVLAGWVAQEEWATRRRRRARKD